MFGIASRLFGQDPKLEFRKQGAGVSLLAGPAIPPDNPYWAQYWLLFDSPTDVITLLDTSTLSLALARRPANIVTLIQVLTTHLFTLLSLPNFPHSSTGSSVPRGLSGAPDEDLAREALNCIRVLSRVVPAVMRPESAAEMPEATTLEDAIFWTSERVKVKKAPSVPEKELPGPEEGEGQFVIEDEDDEDEQEQEQGGAITDNHEKKEEEPEWEDLPTLAERLLTALVDLAFVPGFTVPEECRTSDGPVAHVIWESGIAAPSTNLPPTSQALLSSRLEVLRLLNLLLSLPSLLTPPHLFPAIPNRWREALVSGATLERKVVLCLLCSLLNTAFASSPPPLSMSTISGGLGGLGAAAGKLGGVVLRREDVRGLLTGSCLHLLEILFAEHAEPEHPPVVQPTASNTTNPQLSSSTTSTSSPPIREPSPNTFSFYLSKLHRTSDFTFILSGIFNLLSQALSQPLLPPVAPVTGQKARTGWAGEALVVLWRVIELNPKFMGWLMEQEHDAGDLVVYLLTLCLENKDDETQMGLVRLSAFILQSLTAERGLGVKLNLPIDLKLGALTKYAVPGTLGDFLVVSVYTLIFSTRARLASLYPALVLAITNQSPYFKNLSVIGSTRLTQLFLAFSAPSFLLMEEGNPRLVFYLLETFNNIIHYQLSDNPNLVYSLIRSHKRFEELSTFTLSDGVNEVRRVRHERKAAAAAAALAPPSTASSRRSSYQAVPGVPESRAPASAKETSDSEKGVESGAEALTTTSPATQEVPSEKAMGKRRERSLSVSTIPMNDLNLEGGDGETFVGKNGFVPSESWVSSWREGLPLDSILIMLAELRPKVFELSSSPDNNAQAITFLKSASLSGLLPSPPPLKPRRFIYTPQSITWLASLVYGSIYLGSLELLREVPVQLFAVAQAARRGGAFDLVTQNVAQNVASLMSKVGSRG
ncbi:hypothetical protein T439DRAFT_306349 [Meredithblackwellia eburnea MCA 4105]